VEVCAELGVIGLMKTQRGFRCSILKLRNEGITSYIHKSQINSGSLFSQIYIFENETC
jgi:hypothetical protein